MRVVVEEDLPRQPRVRDRPVLGVGRRAAELDHGAVAVGRSVDRRRDRGRGRTARLPVRTKRVTAPAPGTKLPMSTYARSPPGVISRSTGGPDMPVAKSPAGVTWSLASTCRRRTHPCT